MRDYRLYIDESGDHRYKQLDDLDSRYLGLTGVLIDRTYYDAVVPVAVEALKRKHFTYDIDNPPILVRSRIRWRKHAFGVLKDPARNAAWESDLLAFFGVIKAQIFTVVMDKKQHIEKYPLHTFDPYVYCLAVLLWRIRGYFTVHGGRADILAEARGKNEDNQIQTAYAYLQEHGYVGYGTPEGYSAAFPDGRIVFRKKEHNIAGLQVADLIAFGQKGQALEEAGKPLARPLSPFTKCLNKVVGRMVNRYGRYVLD